MANTDDKEDLEQYSDNFEEYLRKVKPEWSEKQIHIAVDDHRTRNLGLPSLAEKNFAQRMRDWIMLQTGEFRNRDLIDELDIPKSKRPHVSIYLRRFVDEGIVKPNPRLSGHWRTVNKEMKRLDIFNCEDKTSSIVLPFEIHKMVEIRPGNIVVLAGAVNAGKTAFLLNVAADNMYNYDVSYFSSEMGVEELHMRCRKFDDVPFEDWKRVDFWQRTKDFADVVIPGEGSINIIDFLEIYSEFYLVGQYLAEIHDALNGAIAFIALEKNPGVPMGLGGYRSEEKPRLYLSMDKKTLTIQKAKNWTGGKNPNGLRIRFDLVNGCKFTQKDTWSLPEKS
ncbi:MAG: hypothetical protein ACFFCW_43730 [Candidatus Hodarchaeota archaeon]